MTEADVFATNFKTENNPVSIRCFQHEYSWTDEKCEDLQLALVGTLQPAGEPLHYKRDLSLSN